MLKKSYAYLLAPFFMFCVISACQKPDIKFGDQFLDNGLTQITRIDTFGVDLSTVYTDSFPTSAKGVTLVGGYSDPYFGRIDTKTYFEIAPSTTVSNFILATYDSLYLTLRLNQTYYGDTTKPVHIDISRLKQVILAPYTNGIPGYYLFNNEKLAVYPTSLGSIDVLLRPHLTDSIHIRLDDALGKDLFAKFKSNDPIIQNTTNFLNYFYGLCISSNGSSSLVFGCKDSLDFKLMYHLPSQYKDSLAVKFGINNSSHHFTNISVNRASSKFLQNLGPALASGKSNSISSKATGNMAFTQAVSSTMIKIRFPTIQNIFYTTNFAKILKAVLILKPVVGSYSQYYYLPPQLRLSTTNYSNTVGTDLTALTGSGSYATQYGNLFLDYFNGQTSYSYDITNYIKSISVDGLYPYNQSGLLLVPPSPAYETQFSRAIFGDKNNSVANNRVELQIYYATVNTN